MLKPLAQADTAGKYTATLGLATKEGKGFQQTTGGQEAYLTVTPEKGFASKVVRETVVRQSLS